LSKLKKGRTVVNLIQKYREFRADNTRSNPGSFMAVVSGKAILQIGVAFAVGWFASSLMTNVLHKNEHGLVQNSDAAEKPFEINGFADSPVQADGLVQADRSVQVDSPIQREIPAAAASEVTRPVPIVHPAANAAVNDADWLLNQDVSSYVVQLAADTSRSEIVRKASLLSGTHLVVVYPSSKNRDDRLMYGFAIGIYDTFFEAQNEVEKLPESAVAEGVWIRPVRELQKRIINAQQ